MTDKDHLDVRLGMDRHSILKDFQDHLSFTLAKDQSTVTPHDQYQALAYTIRDRLIDRWLKTQQEHRVRKAKRVNYLSLEFLMGRVMSNNLINLRIEDEVRAAMAEIDLDLNSLEDLEMDMGLGNGGLGRLAACFVDSMATSEIPSIGYGIRYNYGIFRQIIEDGCQVEHPDDWLKWGNPWEIPRPRINYDVHFGGKVAPGDGKKPTRWYDTQKIIGMPFDIPVVGYGGKTVNRLRLWSAHAADDFDFEDFNKGDYIAAVQNKVLAENLTKVLYPNDSHFMGKRLRLKQQYLFVSCSLQDIVRRFKKESSEWSLFPERNAIQLNDTHPSLAVPELMRLLVDGEGLDWDFAWQITTDSLGYTNHTLMPEALERWSVELLEELLPRHMQIIYDLNQAFINEVLARRPGDMNLISRVSLIEEGFHKQVRMANLAIVGSHSTNGVAEIHTDLLKSRLVPDFADLFPERFSAKTNGITQRRWLLAANPPLAELVTEAIGDGWITDLDQMKRLIPLAQDSAFRERFRGVKRLAKVNLSNYMQRCWGWSIDPDALFDVHIKRLHEYKRQLLNALHIVMLYDRIRQNPSDDFKPQVFLFGGKAAPGYVTAKLIIKLINDVAATINADPLVNQKLRVYFLPNYRVSLAEMMIPAADLSEQISTAGTEASGTGNMKFMLNGALTIGTHDGANIEIAEEVGAENMFLFGLKTDEVMKLRDTYNPRTLYHNNSEIEQALDLLFSGHFNKAEPHLFEPLRRNLLDGGDPYMLLADLPDYAKAQRAAQTVFADSDEWSRRALLNVANSGKFSSDRTIAEYAREIWQTPPCPVP